jgi:hypothetical protein
MAKYAKLATFTIRWRANPGAEFDSVAARSLLPTSSLRTIEPVLAPDLPNVRLPYCRKDESS